MLLSSCGHPHGAAEIGWGPLKIWVTCINHQFSENATGQ
jgi:hypothetical protein